MYEVMVEEEFCAAHAMRNYSGKCEYLHGHNWKIEVYARGEKLDGAGMLVDFKLLKEATRKVMEYLDHKNLNEITPFDSDTNPSSEEIAAFILNKVAAEVDNERAQVFRVRVWETPSNAATYEIKS